MATNTHIVITKLSNLNRFVIVYLVCIVHLVPVQLFCPVPVLFSSPSYCSTVVHHGAFLLSADMKTKSTDLCCD